MAWFSRKSKVSDETDVVVENEQEKELTPKLNKPKKDRGLFRRSKNMTLIERMQLQESVADGSLEAAQIYLSRGDSAIREVDEGILIIAVTNDLLNSVGLDHNTEEFGSFVQALNAETIDSITLTEDLEDGVIGIIPSADTIDALDEFEFTHEIPFRWAIVPPDLTDDSQLILLDTSVRMDFLVILRDHQDIQLRIENGNVVEIPNPLFSDHDTKAFTTEPERFPDDEDVNNNYVSGASITDQEDEEDGYPPYNEDDDEDINNGNGYPVYEDEDEDEDEGFVLPKDDSDLDHNKEGNIVIHDEPILSVEETETLVNERAEYLFTNTELGLKIDPDKFNAFFAAPTHVRFEISRSEDDGELGRAILEMRRNANTEIDRFHQENIHLLYNEYIAGMNDIHDKIVVYSDHLREDSAYGSKYYEIEATLRDALNDIDRLTLESSREINEQFEQDREDYAENAKREAMAVFDAKYGEENRQRINLVKERLRQDFKTTHDIEVGALYTDRRIVSRRLFDAGAASLLQTLQLSYQEMMQKELMMFDTFRKDMDMYMRRHFADEVLRSKAEAEKLKQSYEADRVRQEYDQLLLTRTRQMEALDEKAREDINRLEDNHKAQMDTLRKEHSEMLQREKQQIDMLRADLENARESTTKIGDQKEQDIAQRIEMYERTIQSKERELQYAKKPTSVVFIALAVIMLTLGIIGGFIFGVSSTHQTVSDQPVYVQPVTNSSTTPGSTVPNGS